MAVRLFVSVTKFIREQLKQGRIYFDSQFQSTQPIVSWPHAFQQDIKAPSLMEGATHIQDRSSFLS
jgi:hypothetical protein